MLSKVFFLIFHFYIQAKNQNEIKNTKIFRRPMSRYNVESRYKEPFQSDNWDDEHHGCWTYGISSM